MSIRAWLVVFVLILGVLYFKWVDLIYRLHHFKVSEPLTTSRYAKIHVQFKTYLYISPIDCLVMLER